MQKLARDQGNSVFVDEHFEVISNQWAYLAKHKRLSLKDVAQLLKAYTTQNSFESYATSSDAQALNDSAILALDSKSEGSIFEESLKGIYITLEMRGMLHIGKNDSVRF